MKTQKDKLLEVVAWLYTDDGVFQSKNDWRKALIGKLYYLAFDAEKLQEEVGKDAIEIIKKV